MRIGIDIRSLLEPQPAGISYYTKNIINTLLEIDKKNQYLLFTNSFRDTGVPNKLLNFSLRFFHWPKIDELLGGCDVFLCPHLSFLALSKKCRKIVVVHDLSFELYPEFYSLQRRLWHRAIDPRHFIGQADKIIAVSQNTKNDLMEIYKIPEEKIKVIYPGVTQQSAPPAGGQQSNYVLTLSTLEPRKNIETLILAFQKAKIADLKLVIAGAAGWKTKNIYRLAANDPNIVFKGYVSEEEKARLYQGARCFAYLSFYEGFGFPTLEALSYGLPVIASLNSSLPEILGEEALYVDPYNVAEVAEALREVIINKVNPYRGEQIKKFSWQKSAQEILNLINYADRH